MLRTRLTEAFGLRHPVVSAPMALAAGGRLAAAVSRAGGLGMIGGGYADPEWTAREYAEAGNEGVGCGFITWSLAQNPQALEIALARAPRALFLSFGDPALFAPQIHAAGVPLICQVQTLADAKAALDAGAAMLVAQGAEAGGHGERRATMTLVPEVADLLAARAPEVLLCAAGGIADGRGLAAALSLGADGAVIGTRFWASEESLAAPGLKQAALAATGDDTLRTKTVDVVRGKDWPARFDIRVMRNAFTDRWHDDLAGLKAVAPAEAETWGQAAAAGDATRANPIVGEATGLLHDLPPAAEILERLIAETEAVLARTAALRA
ncbi:nitronate monooxygenase [Albimonas sp. CAU 1670]|uniref:NAD(P)H-dependent flavin oxidoreductase n=1 Tax=Albimonas sp. CAU 1670 TaxID=3032599 RepID=UPI0023D9BDA4|nr:nitronate monooxygenase [Albimonas sp. CAU 1670]MDF2231137.1 nitronate monooxygenase [Albimonas sp. CAU 1670]